MKRVRPKRRRPRGTLEVIREADSSLLELVDHVLTKGVMLSGDVMLGLANVDLVYLRLSALLCAADRIFPPPPARAARQRRR